MLAGRKLNGDKTSLEEHLQTPGHEIEQTIEVGLSRECVTDLVQRLELPRPAHGGLVQACVLDRDGSLRGQQGHELLVFLVEIRSVQFLGQVEISVGDPAQNHRDAEKRAHRWMVRRETDRAGILAEIVEAQGASIGDEGAEDAPPLGQVADRGVRLGIDAVGDETLQP